MSNDLEAIKARAVFHADKSAEVRAQEAYNYLVDTLECFANITYLLQSEPDLSASTREYTRLATAFLADASERVWHGDLARPTSTRATAGRRQPAVKKLKPTAHLINAHKRTSHIG